MRLVPGKVLWEFSAWQEMSHGVLNLTASEKVTYKVS